MRKWYWRIFISELVFLEGVASSRSDAIFAVSTAWRNHLESGNVVFPTSLEDKAGYALIYGSGTPLSWMMGFGALPFDPSQLGAWYKTENKRLHRRVFRWTIHPQNHRDGAIARSIGLRGHRFLQALAAITLAYEILLQTVDVALVQAKERTRPELTPLRFPLPLVLRPSTQPNSPNIAT